MLFNSYPFLLVFLPSAIAIYAIADRFPRARCPVLIVLSLAFYSYWDIRFLPLMVVSILGNWWLANAYGATKRGGLITLAITANLGVLGYFKYANFFADNLAVLGLPMRRWALALPLGISFFTSSRDVPGRPERRPRAALPLDHYALFICFFPHPSPAPDPLTGDHGGVGRKPYRRTGNMASRSVRHSSPRTGCKKILLGDRLADHVDPVFEAAARARYRLGSLDRRLGFTFQIFFDFSGYPTWPSAWP